MRRENVHVHRRGHSRTGGLCAFLCVNKAQGNSSGGKTRVSTQLQESLPSGANCRGPSRLEVAPMADSPW